MRMRSSCSTRSRKIIDVDDDDDDGDDGDDDL